MRALLGAVALLISVNTFALSNLDLADFYADQLVMEFDRELDRKLGTGQSMIETQVYARLLSARKYLEHSEATPHKLYYPLIHDAQALNAVVNEINATAEMIQQEIQLKLKSEVVIFPSNTSAGNVTGNQFPKGYWALTYDDGPKEGSTEAIVEHLEQSGVKATFFMLMEQVEKFPASAQYVLDGGHELALHSYTHQNLSKATAEVLEYEIVKAKQVMQETLQRPLSFFRLPYGAGLKMENVRKVITDQELVHVFWNVDSLDWKDKDPKSIFARVSKQMKLVKGGGVILFHDIHKQTVEATTLVLDHFHRELIQTCSLSDFRAHANGEEQGCVK